MKYRVILFFILLLAVVPLQSFGEFSSYSIYVGESIALSAKIYEENGEELDENVKWTSSNSSVASVKDGVITAKTQGSAIISYNSTYDGTVHSGNIFVNVHSTVHSVKLHVPKNTLMIGEQIATSYTVIPIPNLSVPLVSDVVYSSSDTSVFTVDKNGIVTAVGDGEAYLKVETTDSGRKDLYKITVVGTVKNVSIDNNFTSLRVGETKQVKAQIIPDSAYLKDVKWDSTHHLKVDEYGNVTGISSGVGYITVYTVDGRKTATEKIEVLSMVDGIQLSQSEIEIDNPQNEYQLTANLIPKFDNESPLNTEILWKSSNSSIANVSDDGMIKVKKDGIVSITATSVDGNHSKSAIVRAVYNGDPKINPTSIYIIPSKNDYKVGESILIRYQLEPNNSTEDQVSIKVFGGDYDVKKHNDHFEVVCYDSGKYTVQLSTENELTTSSIYNISSNIKKIEIKPDSLERDKESDRYIIYRGQKGMFDYQITKAMSSSSILIDDVDWESSNSSVITVDNDGVFTGKNQGEANIRIESKDSKHFDYLPVTVLDMAKDIDLPTYAEIGLNSVYTPQPLFTPTDDLYYGFNEVLDTSFKIEIISISIPTEIIEIEIDYEKDRISALTDLLKSNKIKNKTNYINELSSSKSRLNSLEIIYSRAMKVFNDKKYVAKGYIELDDNDPLLTDRNFNPWKLVSIENKQSSLRINSTSRIVFKVISYDGELEDQMTVYASGETTELKLFDSNGNLISTSSIDNPNIASNSMTQMLESDLTSRTEALKENYTDLDEKDRPSTDTIISVSEAIEFGLVTDAMKTDYTRGVTRLEMAEICIKLYDLNRDEKAGNFSYNVFTDTTDPNAIRAFQYGIVSTNAERLFRPNEVISREEMTHMLYRTVIALDIDLTTTLYPERTAYFNDEDSISEKYRQAVGYLCYDRSIVEGITQDRFWPQVDAPVDYTLHYVMKLIKSIKR